MICYDCTGKGYTLFLGNESTCKPCDGTGSLVVCESYALVPGSMPVAFRNQKCHTCGVRFNDHMAEVVQ